MPKSSRYYLLFGFALIAGASITQSELLLDAKLDDPQGTLAIFGEGITITDAAQRSYQGKNIATAVNAKAFPVLSWPANYDEPRWQQVRMMREDGIGQFLRATQLWTVPKNPAFSGVDIHPQNADSSLAALAGIENGMAKFDGGLDFIVRIQSDPAADAANWRFIEVSGPKSVAFRIASYAEKGLWFTLMRSGAPLFDNDLDGTVESNAVSTAEVADKSKIVVFGKFHHIAITFATDAAGVVTARMFLKEGTGPIDTNKPDDLCGEIRFRMIVPEGELTSILPVTRIPLGTTPLAPSASTTYTMDARRLRIFKSSPVVFPGES